MITNITRAAGAVQEDLFDTCPPRVLNVSHRRAMEAPPREAQFMDSAGKGGGRTPVAPGAVLTVICISNLFGAIPLSAVMLALPEIGRELGLTIHQLSWLMVSYLLSASGFVLIAGRLGDLFGLRRFYLIGFLVLGLGSLLSGMADGLLLLVAGRALQGLGGAMTMSLGSALLTTSFPGSARGRALGTATAAVYVGLTAGPLVGGVLVWQFGWRAVFYAYIPVSVLVIALGSAFLPKGERRPGQTFDGAGTVTLLLGLPMLLLPLALCGKTGIQTWMAPTALGGLLILALFVKLELVASHPLLDLSLFRSRTFSLAAAASVFNYIAIFIPVMLVPFYLEEGLGLPASTIGMVLSAQPLAMALVASPAGRASDRIGTRPFSIVGLVIMAAGLYCFSFVGGTTSVVMVAVWLTTTGLGTGIFTSPNSSALMGSAPPHQQGSAGGVLAVSRNLGMMIGSAAAAVVYQFSGGSTGHSWLAADYAGFGNALEFATFVVLAGVLCCAFQGEPGAGRPRS